jgi:iron complex outermembrane receptor protein
MDFGFGKQMMKSKGTLRVTVRDVLYSQRFRGETKYSNIDAMFQERGDSRVVNLGFTYRFTKGKLKDAPKKRNGGSASEEQNRVGGGN